MPKVTVRFTDEPSSGLMDSVVKILEGPAGPPPIGLRTWPPIYLSTRDMSDEEIGELKKLRGVDVVRHEEE